MENSTCARIRQLRQQKGLTLLDVARQLGVREATVQRYESGAIKNIKKETIAALAELFDCSPEYLLGWQSAPSALPAGCMPLPGTYPIPLLGTIACGEPILAQENIEDQIPVPEFIHADFALRCKGDSMIGARIRDGDVVYIRSQPDVEDGEIAAVLIGEEATLKRVYKIPGRLQLRPENPSYPVFEYAGSELDEIRILGKAVGFSSTVL